MKPLVIVGLLCVAIFIGWFPSLEKRRSFIWKLLIIASVTAAILLGFLPPTAGSKYYAEELADNNYPQSINVLINHTDIKQQTKLNNGSWLIELKNFKYKIHSRDALNASQYDSLSTSQKASNKDIIAKIKLVNVTSQELGNENDNNQQLTVNSHQYQLLSIVSTNPIITFPFIADLQERIRILSFHVPMAWVAVLAYLISMIFSVIYLKKKNIYSDIVASSSAGLGIIFTVLATTTGMVWAKFNWGTYWNWDPRQTSIFILFLIYAAYFALRSAIDNEETKARLSAVYSILAFVTVPFLVFILPRLTTGLHPGSQSDSNAGPVLSSQANMLDSAMLFSFALGLAAFTLLFFWMLNISIRTKKLIIENSNF